MELSDRRMVFVDLAVSQMETSCPIFQVAAIAVSGAFDELESFESRWTRQTEVRHANKAVSGLCRFLRRHATIEMAGSDGTTHRVTQLIAHDTTLAGPVLQTRFEGTGVLVPDGYRILCIAQRLLWFFHEHPNLTPPNDFQLDSLCNYFGVPLSAEIPNKALAGLRATIELYRRMLLLEAAQLASRTY